MSKHTPGPWKVFDNIKYQLNIIAPWSDRVKPVDTAVFGDYKGGYICSMEYNSGVPTYEQALANACLITAAPELLKALELILPLAKGYVADHHFGSNEKYIEIAEQIIAKLEEDKE